MFKEVFVGMLLVAAVFAGPVFAGNDAAKIIFLEGKAYGSVHFSHLKHQQKLGDCELCHQLFPKEMGAIEKGIEAGTLKPRQVMDHCNDCHKETAIAGKRSGPTSCKGCHWD